MSNNKWTFVKKDNPIQFRVSKIKDLLVKSMTGKRSARQSINISQHLAIQTRLHDLSGASSVVYVEAMLQCCLGRNKLNSIEKIIFKKHW